MGQPFLILSSMSQRSYKAVAVPGPFLRALTYHDTGRFNTLEPGQKVVVELGRSKRLGFYVGPSEQPDGINTKPILDVPDERPLVGRELLEFCLWMSEYYLANPYECLISAIPSRLRGKSGANYVWTANPDDESAGVSRLTALMKPGKRLDGATLNAVRKAGELDRLIAAGVIDERWPLPPVDRQKQLIGYKALNSEAWPDFFARKRSEHTPFMGCRSRTDLKATGWSDDHIRQAIKAELLEPVLEDRPDSISEFVAPKQNVKDIVPTEAQQKVLDDLLGALGSGFKVHLLHGITGSGKTLVYCKLAEQVLSAGKSLLVLTPEIALAGTTLAYFRGFFGSLVTVIHSAMTERERLESWQGIRDGRYKIVIGPRSAVFAPVVDPGLIIVDEEHDGAYKQDDPEPRFHGRDCAIRRGQLAKVPVLLGSASPSVESYYHAREGKYQLHELRERPAGSSLPEVQLIDMNRQRLHGDMPYLSIDLKRRIDEALERGEQAIVFLNRRGFSPEIRCGDCGWIPKCPECDLRLTYHKVSPTMACHWCGHVESVPDRCPRCQSANLLTPGAGTQKVEEHMVRLFGEARVLRFDSDTASGRSSSYQLLKSFAAGEYDLLLGTQMVTKGLDLDGVTLVGVLSAEQGMGIPDFRATERTFSRLLQVAGRSGRRERMGKVLIQTHAPKSPEIQDAAAQDYHGFFERTLESRQVHGFPPFSRMVRFVLSGRVENDVLAASHDFANEFTRRCNREKVQMSLLGPAPCPMTLLRQQVRHHLMITTRQILRVNRLLLQWNEEQPRFGVRAGVRLVINVDPDDLM